MKAVTLIILAALLGLSARAAEPAASAAAPLESAKRDLQELPAAQQPNPIPKIGGDPAAAALPALQTPASPAPAPPPSSRAESETWLQDALDAAKSADAAALAAPPQRRGEAALPSDAARQPQTAQPATPLDRYLTQWLSPRDLEILRPELKTTGNPDGTAASPAGANLTTETTSPLRTTGLASPSTPGLTVSPANPYIEEPAPAAGPAAPAASPPPPAATPFILPAARPAMAPAGPTLTTETTSYPTKTPATPPAAPSAGAARTPPPTAPVIDDRKYFPQLRRF